MTIFTGMSASLECENHKKGFEIFCKTHDVPVCVACIPSNHKICPNVIPLETAAKYARTSTALTDVEELIEETTRNIKHYISDRNSASKQLEEQEIERRIQHARDEVNKALIKFKKSSCMIYGQSTVIFNQKMGKYYISLNQ